jgi:trimethylamine:corrinoid methyltransferase-like protein
VIEDLPSHDLVSYLRENDHLITSPHTLKHWPRELYLTDPVIDRGSREDWARTGSKDAYQRACEQVDRRLAAYRPVETDPAIEAEMRRLVISGLQQQTQLPELPPLPPPQAAPAAGRGRIGRRTRP